MKWILIALLATSAIAVAEWSTPVNLGPVVNSSVNDYNPTISNDGLYIVFVSSRSGGFGSNDLWRTEYDGSSWGAPINMGSNVNSTSWETTPYLVQSSTYIYYSSSVTSGGYGGRDIWWASISSGIPGSSSNIGPPINTTYHERNPVLTNDRQTIYFESDDPTGSFGGRDIWKSEYDGSSWGNPTNLGSAVNSVDNDIPAWLSDDGDTLVFYSDRAGSFGGFDLWHIEKSGGVWGTAVNFGSIINSVSHDYGCTFTDNAGEIGGTIYFCSSRAGGFGEQDLYESTVTTNIKSASLGQIKATFK